MSDEPPSECPALDRAKPLIFIIGRDRAGQWIVVERHGLYGGVFASERAATRFAQFESAGRRASISQSSQPLDLYAPVDRAA